MQPTCPNCNYLLIEEKNEINNKEEELAQDGTSGIKLVPIFLYNDTDKKLKVEFKIGNEQLTKINNLPDFFERMLNREKYKYNNEAIIKNF